jgi:MtN3 and saliva related transmembrane protein
MLVRATPMKTKGYVMLAAWIGTAAAIASIVSFTPQAWKIIKTAETKDISAAMYVITVTAFALWGADGLVLRQWPLVASNLVCFLLSGFILVMKLLPKAAKRRVGRAVKKQLP